MNDEAHSAEVRSERLLDGLLRGLQAVSVPLVLAVTCVLVLTMSDQVRELHRILTHERARDMFDTQWLLALASLTALSLVLWQVARQHSDEVCEDIAESGIKSHWVCDWELLWGPRVVAVLPLLGAALGIFLSRLPLLESEEIPESLRRPLGMLVRLETSFWMGIAICIALALIVLIAIIYLERRLVPTGSRRAQRVALFSNWLLFPLVILASIIWMVSDPVNIPQYMGSIPIFALWIVNLAVLFGLASKYYRVFGIPFLGALIVLLVVFETTGWNDNHEFRHTTASFSRPRAETAFKSWLLSRKDLKEYQAANKPYPVYIVAAEGGGLYAAYQTAKFLSRMQDLCPNFAQHVFTISAVSGGSLGAGVFAGLTRTQAQNTEAKPCLGKLDETGPMERRAGRILSRDLLSPVIWAALFPDFLQRFIPYPIPTFDRARALEAAMEAAWERVSARGAQAQEGKAAAGDPSAAGNPFKESFFGLCGANDQACTAGATPALALNVTNIETGMQMVLSQLDFDSIGAPWYGTGKAYDIFTAGLDPVDMPLSTAIGLSARFPWISPAGWYSFPDPYEKDKLGDNARRRRMTFVDGGYVDNSGVATAAKLAQSLTEYHATEPDLPKIEIKMIMITAVWIPVERFWMNPPKDKGPSELVSPLVAALAAWQGRGYSTQYDLAADPRAKFKIIEAGVYYNYMPLPLGWQLSRVSRSYIDLFKGHPERCDETKLTRSSAGHMEMAITYINRADCVAAGIARDLTPFAPAAMFPAITPAQ